ncbi:hypothetical protein HF086_012576 [Spodoptera exigua]|uniref:Uncharacterized protein n=1 Tax=Spodoptera exigua TaxID=7107 RepID=A0A922MM64_SPOEX|nr:hypothetical protein HF086_012576 [Spodoptera exigua]
MAKPKKQTREERLRKKRPAEKKRYENIKSNAELWAEKQEKNRKSYIRRKEQKKQLPINEMPPREQRLQRKRWRTNFKTYYLKKKQEKRTAALLEQNTPPQSPNILSDAELVGIQNPIQESPLHDQSINRELESPVPGPSRITRSNSEQSCRLFPNLEANSFCRKSSVCSSPVSSAVRRIRYNKDKEINHLKQIILKMKRQNERYKKQIQRIMPAKIKEISPVLTDRNTRNSRMKQKVKQTQIHSLKTIPEVLRKEIEVFFEDDENSRLCSGKKECITRNKVRKQKRYISDTLVNLHEKFLKTSSYTISYSAFCKMRPFWVLLPDIRSRDTCLCKLHTNMALIIQGLYQRKILTTKTSQDFLSLICCDVYNFNCLHRTCSACKNKAVCYQEFDNSIEITYWQWETKEHTIQGTARKIRTTEKLKTRRA